MKRTKKRITTYALVTILVLSASAMVLSAPGESLAWDDCPKGIVDDPYPGACSRYADTNGDGICDLSQPRPADTTTTTEAAEEDEQVTTVVASGTGTSGDPPASASGPPGLGGEDPTGTSILSPAEVAATGTSVPSQAVTAAPTGPSLFTHYNVSPIAIVFFLIYAVSFVLHKTKRIRVATHRKIWNVLLLATFLITGIFGLILTVQLDYKLPFTMPINLLFWHVEAGVVMTLISLFHVGWHLNYYRNLVRQARRGTTGAREARVARHPSRAGNIGDPLPALEARAACRTPAVRGGDRPEPLRARSPRGPDLGPEL